ATIAGAYLAKAGHVKPVSVAAQRHAPGAEQAGCLIAEAIVGVIENRLEEAVGRIRSKALEHAKLPAAGHGEHMPAIGAERGVSYVDDTPRRAPNLSRAGLYHLHGLQGANERLAPEDHESVGAAPAGNQMFAVAADRQR